MKCGVSKHDILFKSKFSTENNIAISVRVRPVTKDFKERIKMSKKTEKAKQT